MKEIDQKPSRAICWHWDQKGICWQKQKCKFLHPIKSPATFSSSSLESPASSEKSTEKSKEDTEIERKKWTKACPFFKKGICAYGNDCHFIHAAPLSQSVEGKKKISLARATSPKIDDKKEKEEGKNSLSNAEEEGPLSAALRRLILPAAAPCTPLPSFSEAVLSGEKEAAKNNAPASFPEASIDKPTKAV